MQYNPGAQLDPSQMGGGGRGRGGTVAVGGGASILIIILAMLFGFDPGALLGGGSSAPAPGGTDNPYAHCLEGKDIQEDPECRWVAYQTSIQNYWKQTLSGYQPAQTKTFDGAVNTACGQATAQVGPFYCPADHTVYLDKQFFATMLPQLGAKGGDAAEAYVLAHEYGHHISNLTGVMEQAQRQGQTSGPNSPGVRLELQADCYAGAWLRYASTSADSIISEVTQDDLDRAINAAEVVGDDHIQRMQAGRIDPSQWTHGSSQMRKEWLAKGFNSGDPNTCNTFAAGALD